MNDVLVGVAGFDLGEKLRGADPIDGGRLNKRGIESFKVERTMDVDPSAPCGGFHCGVRPLLDPTEGGLCLIFGVALHPQTGRGLRSNVPRGGKIDGFILTWIVQQATLKCDEFLLPFRWDSPQQSPGLAILVLQPARGLMQPECEYSTPNSEAI